MSNDTTRTADVQHRLVFPGRPPTANAARTKHWSENARDTRSWREQAAWMAKAARIPRLDHCEIIVTQELRDRRSLPDLGACFPAVKAAIDGLVDAGVLVDDGPAYLRRLIFEAIVIGDVEQLVLDVRGVTS